MNRTSLFFMLRIAALCATAVLIAAGVVRILQPQSDERVYTRYRHFPSISADPLSDTLRHAAVKAFAQKNYTSALSLLQPLHQARPTETDIHLLLAYTHLELEQYPPAKAHFNELMQQPANFAPQVRWGLALCLLRSHDRSGSSNLLRTIPPGDPYEQVGKAVLAKIGGNGR
jgi:thioredoxin-like negative regulator of GroEL